jgi:uncharacterized SAM-binding protein YcdF (DUF218 family)
LKQLLLPPGGLVVVAVLALLLQRRMPRTGRAIVAICVVALYVLSTPVFTSTALGALQPEFVEPAERAGGVQAIVLLGGGSEGRAPEYGADNVNTRGLARLRYAARLQRTTGLPLLVSGGSNRPGASSEAEQMREVLTNEMNVPVRWLETRSVDTFTNATESARILAAAGIGRVFLVTHAWHIPRARLAFEHAGLEVVPAPTGFVVYDWSDMRAIDFIPSPAAFQRSYYFFHEVIGYAAYALRTRF